MAKLSRFGTLIPVNTLTQLVEQVYYPPRRDSGWSLEAFLGQGEIRYFSYGRYALQAALTAIGIQQGDGVLVPAFICRDLLAAINSLGATPLYYPVGRGLQMAELPDYLPNARAIVAVNYFGFPQDLASFKAYCDRTGAVLIEDNAHGLLSRDEAGCPLGSRGDLGIFSLRKTFSLPNGAALVLNTAKGNIKLRPQEPFSHRISPHSFRVKVILRKLYPAVGVGLPRLLTLLGRRLRKLRTGNEIPPSPPDAEYQMPGSASPSGELASILAGVDADEETRRRRDLYLALEEIIKGAGGEPVFEMLPRHVVPYVFPFYASGEQVASVKRVLEELRLECHPWPDLPDVIVAQAPEHYKKIWMVNFLW